MRDLACGTFEREGYHVLCAVNGGQAQALFDEHKNDIAFVLLDAAIPKPDEDAMLRALNDTRPTVPILFSTAFGDHLVLSEKLANPHEVIVKPYLLSELQERARRLLDEARINASLRGTNGLVDDPRR